MAHSSRPRTDRGPATLADAAGEMSAWAGDRPAQSRAPLHVTGPATGPTAARARREFAAWLAVDLAAGDLFDDLVLVVYEALANAADHAYLGADTGPVVLLAQRSSNTVHITVSDRGTWRAPQAAPALRGRGLALIRLLVPDVHIDRAAEGTTVHLRAALPAPPTAPA